MAIVEDVMETIADNITAYLAPYQPNLPPDHANADPHAGGIVATLVGTGHPIQYHVTERLENHQAQIGIYALKPEKSIPFFNEFDSDPSQYQQQDPLNLNHYTATFEVARSQKAVVIEVWADTYERRRDITRLLRSMLGVLYRQTEADGTKTVLTYSSTVPFDEEQSDSIWVNQIHVMADFTLLDTDDAYKVTETITNLNVTSDGQTVLVETINDP